MRLKPLKIAHLLPWYAPQSWGGTEQYVAALAGSLQERGVQSLVLAPSVSGVAERYQHQGVAVQRYVGADAAGSDLALRAALVGFDADVLHLHGWTPQCGARELASAAAIGLATVLTVHIPGTVCASGSMLHRGTRPCTRVSDARRCAACWLQSHRVPRPLAEACAALPEAASRTLRRIIPGRVGWLPGARSLMAARLRDGPAQFARADRVVAVCAWLQEALLALGSDPARTRLCRQGLDHAWLQAAQGTPAMCSVGQALRVAFVGRWDRVKGLHVLIAALQALPSDRPWTLHAAVAAPADAIGRHYREQIMAMIAGDDRVRLATDLPRAALAALIGDSHLVAIPSQCLETGPLVALEARALGRYVLASSLGGLIELLGADPGAECLPFDDPPAWTAALARCHPRRAELAAGIAAATLRSSHDVAREMHAIYADALAAASARRAA